MNRLLPLLFLFVLSATPLAACINEYHTRIDGSVFVSQGGSARIDRYRIDRKKARQTADKILETYHRSVRLKNPLENTVQLYSDYGVQLIYLGEYGRAKAVYREIERMSPNRYRTASNLGTVYELLGQNDSALVWIRKAVALNPNAHEGSEWIHIKILKFKLRQTQQPDASLLGMSFGTLDAPCNPYGVDLKTVSRQLAVQLEERTKLVPPKDAIVGRLYFDLANLYAQTTSVEWALPYYREAQRYGYTHPLVAKRIAAMEAISGSFSLEKTIDRNKGTLQKYFILFAVGGLVIGIGFLVIVWRVVRKVRRRFKIKSKRLS